MKVVSGWATVHDYRGDAHYRTKKVSTYSILRHIIQLTLSVQVTITHHGLGLRLNLQRGFRQSYTKLNQKYLINVHNSSFNIRLRLTFL